MARLKSFTLAFMVGASLYVVFNSCMDQQLSSNPAQSLEKNEVNGTTSASLIASPFSSDVGAPIDQEKAVRWMRNFAIANKDAVREHTIPVDLLKSILGSDSSVGVAFYYAVDDSKAMHIIPIGVDRFGKMIRWKSIALGNASLEWQTAWRWINNYDGSVRSHFFGSEILVSTFLKNKNMRVSRALNDDGVPQLLLSNGDVTTPQGYGDESGSCPPFCPSI